MLVAASIGAVFVVGAGAVAVANSGSDHGGATAAAATASLAPSTNPTSSAAIGADSLRPIVEFFKPLIHNGTWRPTLKWHMANGSPVVEGWRIYAVNPANYKLAAVDGYFPANGTTLTSGKAVQWNLAVKVPLNWCARVDTISRSAPYQSQVWCPSPSAVKAAQAANAKLAKAAKNAAAKKKSHSA
jgi:hypothetical protein